MAGPAAEAGYAIERERGALIVALPSVMADVLSHVRQHGTLYDAAAARPDAESFTGRGAAWRMTTPHGDWLVRHYRRGGAIARVLHDEYLRAGEPRPLRELHASIIARARGVDTPEIVAAIAYLAGPLYRADLATRFVAGSRDLATVTFGSDDDLRAADIAAAWHAAGRLLRVAFAAGIEHADLNLRNILIADAAGAPRALLLDLDRAVIHERAVTTAVRSGMLARLHRSRRKLEQAAGRPTGAAELAAFEAGLGGLDA
ncbi:MAG TPA: lipopolysaccharide kinase InaA family protein [Longimicrobiales bacterium]|nr:lipopolysaccharide kinase InaA family protein [Longimicrobiales bacterium]